jgi:hypothetical protein
VYPEGKVHFRWFAVLMFLLLGCAPRPEPKSEPQFPVKITQFYASPGEVPPGGRALLCYGVEFAASVKIDPYPEKLPPAVSRCVEVFPAQATTYKLTATGRDGKTAEQTAEIRMGSGAPPGGSTGSGAGPRLRDLAVSAQRVKKGDLVSFCFKADNAVSVQGGPGKFQKGGLASGDCLLHQPDKTTTYRITVKNAAGQSDTDSITVKVE